MSSTDDRIVKMQFDNAQFKKGAAETQKSLADVNKAVDAAGKGKGLLDLNSNMERVSVTASKMAVVTTTALATIANKVTNTALSLASSLTFDPIKQGFSEYESLLTKQNVIMNATGKSSKTVKRILNELNAYSDQTIYSFGNMTDAITKFTNAGIDLPTSVTSIKGIANAAAFAGASAEEANRAMYAFSQSMSLGFVGLQDWMQIENANMGTVQFKNELLNAAVAAGTLTRQGDGFVTSSGKFVSATKGWRDGLQDQWATTEVLNKALGKYADQNTKLGKKAFNAATQVRTFSSFLSTLKESLGSGWSQIFTALFGGLGQATKMWTGLSNSVGGAVEKFFHFATTALKTWRSMGGFQKTIEGFQNILAPFGAILEVIGEAWSAAFPNSDSGAGKALYGLSAGFAAVTAPLQLLADLIRLLTKPLTFFFQVIGIGVQGVKELVGLLVGLVKHLGALVDIDVPSSGGMLGWIKDLGSAIGGAVDQISTLIGKGKSIGEAFKSVDFDMPDLPSMPSLPSFGGGDGASEGASQAAASIGGMAVPLTGLGRVLEMVKTGFELLSSVAQEAGDDISSAGGKMGAAFETAFGFLVDVVKSISMDDIVSSFNMAVLATFLISAARLLNTFSKSYQGFMGIGESVNGLITDAGGALKSFQTAARAKLILNIGIAVGILAASLWVLSKIPGDVLAARLVALGTVFIMLNSALKNMGATIRAMDQKGMAGKLIAFSVAIMALASAMLILATALILFKYVEWESIAKGLITMGVAMKLIQGIGTMGKFAAKNMVAGAFGIMAISQALLILAGALVAFQFVKWESMGKAGAALAGITASLLLLGALMQSKYGAAALAAAGAAMFAASNGMLILAGALILFEKVKWESMKKAGVALGGLALGLTLMLAGLPGALALPIAGVGLIALSLGLRALDKVKWSTIPKMIVAFGALAIGLAILTPVLYLAGPALIMFGIAIMSIGAGIFLFVAALTAAATVMAVGAAAISAFAIAAAIAFTSFIQTLALEAPLIKEAFLTILQSIIDGIVEAVPMIIQGIKDLWAAVAAEFSNPTMKGDTKKAGSGWVQSAGDGVQAKMPEIVKKAADLLVSFLRALSTKADEIAEAGAGLVVSVMEGIGRRIDDIATTAVKLITKFATGIGNGLPDIITAGITLIADFLHALANGIRFGSGQIGAGLADVIDAFFDVGANMIQGLIEGMKSEGGNAASGLLGVVSPLAGVANKALDIQSPSRVFKRIGAFLVQGLTLGIQNNAASAITAVASMVSGQIAVANEYVNGFIQKLDQQAIAARAKANGLALAADKAAKAANKTKTKADDRAANRLGGRAEKADKVADKAERKAAAAKEAEDRRERFRNASSLERAKIRSEDAQRELDAAKAAEFRAARNLAEAEALEKQAKAEGVTAKQRKQMQKEADELRAQAKKDAQASNKNLADARKAAADALAYQKKAGDEAAAAFQAAFDSDAKEAADEAAFELMSNAEKAELRRKQAAELEAKAAEDLKKAKELAYTDIDAANDLASLAMAEADRARDYLEEATRLAGGGAPGSGGVLGTVVNMDPTEAAALAMSDYSDLVSSATAAAASSRTVEFNQYNTSPEALSPSEVYRQTNNLFTYAVDKIDNAAA